MPTKKKKVIVCLVTKKSCYEVGQSIVDDAWVNRDARWKVTQIEAKRDGETGLYKEGEKGAHYVVTLTDGMSDKLKLYDVIPIGEVKQISFSIEEVSKGDNGTVEMTSE